MLKKTVEKTIKNLKREIINRTEAYNTLVMEGVGHRDAHDLVRGERVDEILKSLETEGLS